MTAHVVILQCTITDAMIINPRLLGLCYFAVGEDKNRGIASRRTFKTGYFRLIIIVIIVYSHHV